jgi:hypothetical protein
VAEDKIVVHPQSGLFATVEPNYSPSNGTDMRSSAAYTSLSNPDTVVSNDDTRQFDVPAQGIYGPGDQAQIADERFGVPVPGAYGLGGPVPEAHEFGIPASSHPYELGVPSPPPQEMGIPSPAAQEVGLATIASQAMGYTQPLGEVDDETLQRRLEQVRNERARLSRIDELSREEAELESILRARRQ